MQFSCLLSLAAAALVTAGVSAAQPGPGVSNGSQGQSHDPTLIRRDDGTLFKFSTNNMINTETASSIEGPWKLLGSAMPHPKATIANFGDLWAPDVHKVGDYYYMFYCLASKNVQTSAIAVARSKTMNMGDWEDLGAIPGLASDGNDPYNTIDPNFIATSDGEYYLNFGSFWTDIYQVKLNPDNLAETIGKPYQISFQPADDHAEEGSFVFQNGEYYYLLYSAGACCGLDVNPVPSGKEYQIKMCRSTKVDGDFVDQAGVSCMAGGGTTLLSSHDNVYAPGGQGIFTDTKTEETILYYHYADLTLGKGDGDKKLGWNVLNFTGGWPVPQGH